MARIYVIAVWQDEYYRYDVLALLTVFLLQNGNSQFRLCLHGNSQAKKIAAATDARETTAFFIAVVANSVQK